MSGRICPPVRLSTGVWAAHTEQLGFKPLMVCAFCAFSRKKQKTSILINSRILLIIFVFKFEGDVSPHTSIVSYIK